MGRTDTNRQWTTYRILDATIDNPDLADPFNLGATGAAEGKGFILWGDTSAAKIEWEEDSDRLLTTSATIRMGTTDKLEFRDTSQYIYSSTGNQLDLAAGTAIELHQDTILTAGKSLGLSGNGYFAGWYLQMTNFKAKDGTASFSIADSTGIVTMTKDLVQDSTTDATGTTDGSIQTDGGVGIAMKLFVGTNLDVAGTSALDGNVTLEANLYMPSAGVIDFGTGDVTLTHASNLLTVEGGNLRLTGDLSTTGRLEFYSANAYITSDSDGEILFSASGQIRFGATNGIVMNSYLKLLTTDTAAGSLGGAMWQNSTAPQVIKYRVWDVDRFKTRTVAQLEDAQTFTGNQTISGSSKLYLRDTNTYIYSSSSGDLNLVGSTSVTTGSLFIINNYLKLWVTGTAGGNTAGLMWMDNTAYTIKYRRYTDPTHWNTRTLVTLEEEQEFAENITMAGAKKLMFLDSDLYIYAVGDGELALCADSKIINYANTYIDGFLGLKDTTSVGNVAGQIWYDSSTKKIHFWDGTAEQEVQSAGA